MAQTFRFSDPGDGGARQEDLARDLPERLAEAAQGLHLAPLVVRCAALQLARAAGAVCKPRHPLKGMAGKPFVHGCGGYPNRQGNLTRRLAGLPSSDNQGSHLWRGFGILVDVHGLSPEHRAASQTPQSPVSAREQPIETLQLEAGFTLSRDRSGDKPKRIFSQWQRLNLSDWLPLYGWHSGGRF